MHISAMQLSNDMNNYVTTETAKRYIDILSIFIYLPWNGTRRGNSLQQDLESTKPVSIALIYSVRYLAIMCKPLYKAKGNYSRDLDVMI